MPWESTYLQALESAREYKLENGQLRIVFANGQGTLMYVSREGEGTPPVEQPIGTPTAVIPGMPTTGGGDITLLLVIVCLLLVSSGAILGALRMSRK